MVARKKPYFAEMPIKDLVLDKAVQMRASLNRSAILEYADNYEAGVKMPPIVVYWIPGQKKYVADGFHRVLAKKGLTHRGVKGHTTIKAQIRTGTKRDAILFAAGANRSHGVRRTNEDKAKTVLAFLGDSQWVKWTDAEIARHAGVSAPMVGKYRKWLGERAQSSKPDELGRTERISFSKNGETIKRRTPQAPEGTSHERLTEQLNRELCPYCGQKMPGHRRGKRTPGRRKKLFEAKQ